MILHSTEIASRLQKGGKSHPLIIKPCPNLEELAKCGQASVDLRLGTWFSILRPSKASVLDVSAPKDRGVAVSENRLAKMHYIPFGEKFVVHPRTFVLGVTLEWLKFPRDLCGEVIGRSSWGRRGLIIATATGIHPGFTGCLTLEITNVGEIPIAVQPGLAICQIFFNKVDQTGDNVHSSSIFNANRKPTLGEIRLDNFAISLSSNK